MSLAAQAHAYLKAHAREIAKDHPALAAWLPLFGITLHAVNTESQATGHDDSGAATAVASTLTPGLANSTTLTGPATGDPADGDTVDGGDVDAVGDALEPGATPDSAAAAVQAQPTPAS